MKLNNTINMIRRFAVVATLALGATGLYGESLPIRISIPFAFTVGGSAMPAGEYTISPLMGLTGGVMLRNEKEHAGMIALALPGSEMSSTPMEASATFTVVDEGRVLSTVKAPGWTLTFRVPAPLTKELAKRMEEGNVVTIAAR